jgi:hypothetical protein
MPVQHIRNGVEVSGTSPCPQVTVKGILKCLDRTCPIREIPGSKCPPGIAEGELPDFLANTTPEIFQRNLAEGAWDSHVVAISAESNTESK